MIPDAKQPALSIVNHAGVGQRPLSADRADSDNPPPPRSSPGNAGHVRVLGITRTVTSLLSLLLAPPARLITVSALVHRYVGVFARRGGTDRCDRRAFSGRCARAVDTLMLQPIGRSTEEMNVNRSYFRCLTRMYLETYISEKVKESLVDGRPPVCEASSARPPVPRSVPAQAVRPGYFSHSGEQASSR
jgi:hypothetical protein